MNKPLFSKLVRCGLCGSNMISKKERGIQKFICSKYKKDSSQCIRIPVEQNYIIQLIKNRYGEISDNEIKSKIDYIEVFEKWRTKEGDSYKLTIHFKDDKPIILAGNDSFWQF